MLTHAPIYVYVLRVGSRYYYDQGSKAPGDVSVLRAYLTEVRCDRYRCDKASTEALQVDAVELGELWDLLPQISGHSAVEYGVPLVLEVDGEVLWDGNATIH